jgi:peptide/nickel transport system substrate-binding protein
MNHRRTSLVLIAPCMMLLACGDPAPRRETSAPESARVGGTAVIAIPADFHSLDPVIGERDSEGQLMQDLLFAPLVRYDSALVARPWLAERWDTASVAGDSLDLTFHLRRDVRWHDGVPTRAGDVAFAFARMQDPRTAYPHALLLRGYSPRARVLDDSTIRFRLRPLGEYLEVWSRIGGLPEHLLREVPPGEEAQAAYGRQPVGNGPFRFAARLPGHSFTLVANRDFPAGLGGRPYLDTLVHRVIPDGTTRLTELATGAVDLVSGVTPEQLQQVRSLPGMHLVAYRTPTWVYIAWNTRLPLFHDARVRQALTMAIDRPGLVEGLFHGYAAPGRATVTPVHWAFAARDPASVLAYDPAAAERLLDQAGWRQRDGSGIRSDSAGTPLRFTLGCPAQSMWCDVAAVVQADLHRVGVEVLVQQQEMNALLAAMGRGGRERAYQAAVMNTTDYLSKTDEANFGSRAQGSSYAETGFSSPVLDSLFTALDTTRSRQAALDLWLRYQREMAAAAPVTVLYYPSRLTAHGERLHGVRMDARGFYVSGARWWVATGRAR